MSAPTPFTPPGMAAAPPPSMSGPHAHLYPPPEGPGETGSEYPHRVDKPAQQTGLGTTALMFAIVAAVGAPLLMAIPAAYIGAYFAVPDLLPTTSTTALGMLSPVRTEVLWLEIGFWVGTASGLTAIVLGIVAMARRRGSGRGLAALILAILAPGIAVVVATMGLAAGTILLL